MTKVEKLKEIGILRAIRQRLGAENGEDTSKDLEINKMTADHIVMEWCGWELGDGRWWVLMKNYFDELQEEE